MSNSPHVWTDGACVGQGLNTAKAGYGVYWGDNHPNNRQGSVNGQQDSNRAELLAVQVAMKTAISQGHREINLHTDSQYVKDAVKGASSNSGQNRDIVQSINDLSRQIKVNVEKVAGHSGIRSNEKANELAKAGARQ